MLREKITSRKFNSWVPADSPFFSPAKDFFSSLTPLNEVIRAHEGKRKADYEWLANKPTTSPSRLSDKRITEKVQVTFTFWIIEIGVWIQTVYLISPEHLSGKGWNQVGPSGAPGLGGLLGPLFLVGKIPAAMTFLESQRADSNSC